MMVSRLSLAEALKQARTEAEIKESIILLTEEEKKLQFPITVKQYNRLQQRKWVSVDVLKPLADAEVARQETLRKLWEERPSYAFCGFEAHEWERKMKEVFGEAFCKGDKKQ